jgi:hypothetical protein
MSGKRNIAAIPLSDFAPSPMPTARPEITWIDPRDLLVDEAYQRNLSERSLALIRRIATGWDWRRFKAPSCSWTSDGLEVVDGQHTAIGAACRGDITEIPVLITEAKEQAERAAAFIGLNRDRVGITATQLHAAAVTAGDADALAIEEACSVAGIAVLKTQPGAGRFKPRETMAVAALGVLVKRHGSDAGQVLSILAEAGLAPIQANHIKAVELLLTDPEYSQVELADITRSIITVGVDAENEAKLFAATHRIPVWKALAIVWFRKARKNRKAGSPPVFGASKAAQPAPKLIPPIPPAPLREEIETKSEPKRGSAFLDDVMRDQRPERGKWKAGRHLRRCSTCDCRFEGAVNSTQCADCAYQEV